MRLPRSARSLVATLSVTALITGGGLVSGAFVGTASATEVYTVKSPAADTGTRFVTNSGVQSFRIYGSRFQHQSVTFISLHRSVAADGQGDIPAADYEDNTLRCTVNTGGPTCGDTFDFTADMTNAAPGIYDVIVEAKDPSGEGPPVETDTCIGCVEVIASGAPALTSVARYNGTDGQLTFSGSFLPKGTKVEFLLSDGATVDNYMSLVPTTTSGNSTVTGYISPTVMRGTYTATSQATPGLHKVRVRTTDDQISNTIDFYQPVISSISASVIGQGASQAPITVNGTGLHPAASFSIAQGSTTAADVITVGTPTANTATSVTAPVTVQATSATTARAVTLRGPDGGYTTTAGLVTIANGPKFANSNPVTPTTRGQGSDTSVTTVSGQYFNMGSVFNFGNGVTATTLSVTGANTTSSAATLRLLVAPDAPLSTRSVVVTNTDFGSATLANGWSVTPSPKVTSLDPPSGSPGTGPFNVILNGSDFTSGQSFGITLVPATGITVGTVNRVSNTQLQTTFTLAAGAAAGPRDVVVTNTSTGGTSTCVSCFGINSLSVSPGASSNTVVRTLTLTSNLAGSPLSTETTVRVFLPGPPAYQDDIDGTNVVYNASTGKVTADVDLRNVATGNYNVETTTGTTVLTCTGCLTVTSPANPVVSSLSPNTGGQGATDRLVTITGNNFSPGETVTFSGSGVTATDVTFVSPTEITAKVTVAAGATVGARNVTVSNIGDKKAGSLTNGFTVTAAPVTTSIDPAQIGQGATVDVTLTGTGYTADATATVSGAGVTAVLKNGAGAPTTLVYTVTVASDADTATPRSLTVTNSDGGSSTLASALVIKPAPKITAIAPSSGKAGTTLTDVTITGTNFATATTGEGDTATTTFPTVIIGSVTVTVKSATEDGTTLVADFVIRGDAASGLRSARVINPDKGEATTADAFTVATDPSAPLNVQVNAGDKQATVTWDAPADQGGSPLTQYVVDDGDANTNNSVTVPADQPRTATITGLTNGTTYTFTVKAVNGVGTGAAGTASGTPKGAPLPPTSVTATSTSSSITVSWSGADAQGSPITKYTVKATNGQSSIEKTVDAPATSVTFDNLFTGTTYTFTVKATNGVGDSAFSTASATATPKFATRLTSTRSPVTAPARTSVLYAGRLTRTDNTPIGGATILVKLTPDIGSSRTVSVTTNSDGNWSFRFAPTYNTLVRASWAGDTDEAAATATAYRMGVSTRLTRTSPASGATSAASTTIAIKGTTTPNKAGRAMALYRGSTVIARTTVASNGTWTFNVRLPRGTYTLFAYIGNTSGNVAGKSAPFVIRRT